MSGGGAISTQIAIEYFDVSTRSRRGFPPLKSYREAVDDLTDLATWLHVADVTHAVFTNAMRIAHAHQMRIFDAQLVATARAEGIQIILTEDLQSAPVIEGVRYVDPFRRAFRASSIGL